MTIAYRKPAAYVSAPMNSPDLNALMASVTVEQVTAFYGQSMPPSDGRREVRMDCPCACYDGSVGRQDISVNTQHPAKFFKCHAYQCMVKGNLFKLMYMLKHGKTPP